MAGGGLSGQIGQIDSAKREIWIIEFSSELFLERREGRDRGPMLRHQSKEKEAAGRRTDMTAPEVSSRILLLKKRNAPSPAGLTAEFNMTLKDRSFSKALKATVSSGNERKGKWSSR